MYSIQQIAPMVAGIVLAVMCTASDSQGKLSKTRYYISVLGSVLALLGLCTISAMSFWVEIKGRYLDDGMTAWYCIMLTALFSLLGIVLGAAGQGLSRIATVLTGIIAMLVCLNEMASHHTSMIYTNGAIYVVLILLLLNTLKLRRS